MDVTDNTPLGAMVAPALAPLREYVMNYYHVFMIKSHNKRERGREPVQVYLTHTQHVALRELADRLDASLSDVVRMAIERLHRATVNPDEHPALRVAALGAVELASASPLDVARDHDRYLADTELESWQRPRPLVRPRKRAR